MICCPGKKYGALKKVYRKLHNYTLLTIHIDQSSNDIRLTNSKPCSDCLEFIKKVGIKKIMYSTSDGKIVEEKVSDIQNTKITYSKKKKLNYRIYRF